MTKGDLDGVTLLGRPIKPVALGISVIMASYTLFNVLNLGVFQDIILGNVLSVIAGMSFVLLTVGWWGKSQKMAEWGLLAAAVTFLLRSSFVFLVGGFKDERVYLTLGMVTISCGAYLLERWDGN